MRFHCEESNSFAFSSLWLLLMSDYLNSADSGSDDEKNVKSLTEEEVALAKEEATRLKAEGNDFFGKGDYDEALIRYTGAINALKRANLPKDALILLNRSATYLALKRYVPAMNDANQGMVFALVCI